jgi:hypothetical protein
LNGIHRQLTETVIEAHSPLLGAIRPERFVG